MGDPDELGRVKADLKEDIQAYEAERGRSAPGRPSRTAARATKAQAAAEGSDDDGEEREPVSSSAVDSGAQTDHAGRDGCCVGVPRIAER